MSIKLCYAITAAWAVAVILRAVVLTGRFGILDLTVGLAPMFVWYAALLLRRVFSLLA